MANDHDLNGRQYANFKTLKAGDWLETDGGFDCMPSCAQMEVKVSEGGEFYVECAHGQHFLDGQCDQNCEWLIGLYPVRRAA